MFRLKDLASHSDNSGGIESRFGTICNILVRFKIINVCLPFLHWGVYFEKTASFLEKECFFPEKK